MEKYVFIFFVSQCSGDYLKQIMYMHYVTRSVSDDDFVRLVSPYVLSSQLSFEYLLHRLCRKYSQYADALKWVKTCSFLPSDIHYPIELLCYNDWALGTNESCLIPSSKFDSVKSYLQLPSDVFQDISFIQSKSQFDSFMTELLETTQNNDDALIAIDTESTIYAMRRMSLIQIAVKRKIYFLDILSLSNCLQIQDWQRLVGIMFYHKGLRKLGFDFSMDIAALKDTFLRLGVNFSFVENVICVQRLLKNAVKLSPSFALLSGFESRYEFRLKRQCSLSDICQLFLGKKLSKTHRVSHWGHRPLSEEQIRYAALDAFCLLEIYDRFSVLAKKCELDLESVIEGSLCDISIPATKPKDDPKRVLFLSPSCYQTKPNNSSEFSFLVDKKLYGLGVELRRFGMDCLVLKGSESWQTCFNLCEDERRQMVLYDFPLAPLAVKSKLPNTAIILNDYGVARKFPAFQFMWILNYFNIVLTRSDIYSRCTVCNGDLTSVPHNQMLALWRQHYKPVEHKHSSANAKETKDNVEIELIEEGCGVINRNGCVIHTGAKVDVTRIPVHIFDVYRDQPFQICVNCGNTYWMGVNNADETVRRLRKQLERSQFKNFDIYQKHCGSLEATEPVNRTQQMACSS